MDFLRVKSLAFLAASLALALLCAFSIIILPTFGFSSKKVIKLSYKKVSTIPRLSLFPSFALVCPSNCGLGSFIETIPVRPSLVSSP